MNRTLYVSDLDGTLLQSDETLSACTCNIMNNLMEQGMIFSYATARSFVTASKVTVGLNAQMPVIVYNGAFILDNVTKKRLVTNTFTAAQAAHILQTLGAHQIAPLVYALIDGAEKFSYQKQQISTPMKEFLCTRRGDCRDNPMNDERTLLSGQTFYFTCIDDAAKLHPACEVLKKDYRCLYQKDIYTGAQWLEILPLTAKKATAALQLKELYHCDKLISFGDQTNDLDLFAASDECYAVANANQALKKIATGVIENNNADGVARWLKENAAF